MMRRLLPPIAIVVVAAALVLGPLVTTLSARDYFALVRKAREAVKIPETFNAPRSTLTVSPDEVEAAFVAANPGLPRDGRGRPSRKRPSPYGCRRPRRHIGR